MYSDKKCVVCKKIMPNSHHLKQYCEQCLIKVKKSRSKLKQEIKRKRNEAYNNLSEKEKSYLLEQARKEIMKNLENGSSDY